MAAKGAGRGRKGFTIVELLTVVTTIGVLSAVAIPAVRPYYEQCCVKAAVFEIAGMIKEAKQNALTAEQYYAIGFNPVLGKVSLIAGMGEDGIWNTADDKFVRSFSLAAKGGGLRYGYGAYRPLPEREEAPFGPTLAVAPDGISFPNNNALICNPELTGTAGVVYLITGGGIAMAIKMNSTDYGYTLWRWNVNRWARL